MTEARRKREWLKRENQKWPVNPMQIPEAGWPYRADRLIEVWRSRDFLIQVFAEVGNVTRLSVCRTQMASDGNWQDGISWEELQWLKRCVGRGDAFAVEIYPSEEDTVNVANMRHLWILPEPLDCAWRAARRMPIAAHRSPQDESAGAEGREGAA